MYVFENDGITSSDNEHVKTIFDTDMQISVMATFLRSDILLVDSLQGSSASVHLESSYGDDILAGGDGDDVIRAGYGFDILTGGLGQDDFIFYAAGHFRVTDYTTSDDDLVFDSATTGLHDLDDLLRVITNISDSAQGVVIEFGLVASITLVGLSAEDLNTEMVHFI